MHKEGRFINCRNNPQCISTLDSMPPMTTPRHNVNTFPVLSNPPTTARVG